VRIVHDGATLVRHRGVARIVRTVEAPAPWRVDWRGERELDLGSGRGRVRFTSARGAGIAADLCRSGEWHFAPRHGGERLRLAPGGPTRTLKNLLREAAVPEWQRERLPLLFHGSRIAWVPGIGVAADLACAPGGRGLVPDWTPADSAPPG
jgi:tRNA(Ile)-lysidine synthase